SSCSTTSCIVSPVFQASPAGLSGHMEQFSYRTSPLASRTGASNSSRWSLRYLHVPQAADRNIVDGTDISPHRQRLTSEEALWNDDYVTRSHRDVGGQIACPQKIAQAHPELLFSAAHGAQDAGAIPRGEIGDTPHQDHDIENRHVFLVGERLRPRRFA